MTVGSPVTDSLDAAKKHVGLRFVCLSDKNTRFPELPDFPPKACKGGIMTVHHFVRYIWAWAMFETYTNFTSQ
jgi:hypothetical protein